MLLDSEAVENLVTLRHQSLSQVVNAFYDPVSDIRVGFDGKTANAKSAMDLLLLGATHGTVLTLEASGADAEQALAAAVEVLETEKEVEGSA